MASKKFPGVAAMYGQDKAPQSGASKESAGNLLNKASKGSAVQSERVVYLDRDLLVEHPGERVIYDVLELDALALDISKRGIQSPLQVIPMGGEYAVVSGHRRRAANDIAVEKYGYSAGEKIPCIVKAKPIGGREFETTEDIILDNLQRDKSDFERMMEIVEFYRCTEMRRAKGENIPNIRERVKDRLGVSDTEITRFKKIHSSLAECFASDFRTSRIASTVAYDIAQMEPECQTYISEHWDRIANPVLTIALVKDYVAQYIAGTTSEGNDTSQAKKVSYPIPKSVDEGLTMLCSVYNGLTETLRCPAKLNKATEAKVLKKIAKQVSLLNELQSELTLLGFTTDAGHEN